MSDRAVREFAVYTDGRLALVARDEPGTLGSTAGPPAGAGPPPPPGPPPGPGEPLNPEPPPGVHPFIDAQAYDPVSEDRLRRLLDESSGFDDYLERLLGAGFDIASCRPSEGLDYELPGSGPADRGRRARGRLLAGAGPVHHARAPARRG